METVTILSTCTVVYRTVWGETVTIIIEHVYCCIQDGVGRDSDHIEHVYCCIQDGVGRDSDHNY